MAVERLGILLQCNKPRSENRSLLPPQDEKPWNCAFCSCYHKQDENKTRSRTCWPFLNWIHTKTKSNTSCCRKDHGFKSQVHPLSSRIIRRRNSHSMHQDKLQYKYKKSDDKNISLETILSKSSSKRNKSCKTKQATSTPQQQGTPCCLYQPKFHQRIGQTISSVWPEKYCDLKTHAQSIRSSIATSSTWCWHQSSNSKFQDFLEDSKMLKDIDSKDFMEYRELLLNEPLTEDRLQCYPKIVLRAFVYLLRNQQPPNNFDKRLLIRLCTEWTCKNKNYFCTFEEKSKDLLEKGPKSMHLSNTILLSKKFDKAMTWISTKKDALKSYTGTSSSHNHKQFNESVNNKQSMKLSNELMFDEQKELVCDNEDEKCDNWCHNESKESSNIFEGIQETFCPCFTCSNDNTFCYGCMCTICKDTGPLRESMFWLKCIECIHITHLQCASKVGFVGFNSTRNIDGEYWCQSCDAKKDLISYWKSLLKEASKCDNVSRLEVLLYCAMSILKNTKRSRYEDLQALVCEAWGLVAKGAQLSDIQILIEIICANFESIDHLQRNDDPNKNVQESEENYLKQAEGNIEGVQETIKEVEAWKLVLLQTEEQLKRLKLKLELKAKMAHVSNTHSFVTTTTTSKRNLHYSDDGIVVIHDSQ